MTETVKFERRGKTALLTLNRPEKLNALDYATNDLLLNLLDDIERDTAIQAVVLTGAGDRAFSAGADIHEFTQSIKQGADIAVPGILPPRASRDGAVGSLSKTGDRGGQRDCLWRRLRDHRSGSSRACLLERHLRQARDQYRHSPDIRRHAASAAPCRAQTRARAPSNRRSFLTGEGL